MTLWLIMHPEIYVVGFLVLLASIVVVVVRCRPWARVAAVLFGGCVSAYAVHRAKVDAVAWANMADMINAKMRCARGREIVESIRESARESNWVTAARQLDMVYENACPIYHPDTNASDIVEEIVKLGRKNEANHGSQPTLDPGRGTDGK